VPIELTDDQISLIAEQCNPEDPPADIPEIAEFIGINNALKLAARLGCGSVYLRKWSDSPDQWGAEIHRMIEVIGRENTATIVRLFDGNYINIPKCTSLFLKYRNQLIASEKVIKTRSMLAREYGLTQRQIKRIINSAE